MGVLFLLALNLKIFLQQQKQVDPKRQHSRVFMELLASVFSVPSCVQTWVQFHWKEKRCGKQFCPHLVTLHSPSFKMHPVKYFECLQTVMSEIRDKLREYLSEKWSKISLTVRSVDVLLPRDEPKTKDEFLKRSCKLTLDPDVVHTKIFLSNQNRTVSNSSDYNTWP